MSTQLRAKKNESSQPKQAVQRSPEEENVVQVVQHGQIHPQSLSPADVLRLQRTIGNQAVQRMLAPHSTPSVTQPTPTGQPVVQRALGRYSAGQVKEQGWRFYQESGRITPTGNIDFTQSSSRPLVIFGSPKEIYSDLMKIFSSRMVVGLMHEWTGQGSMAYEFDDSVQFVLNIQACTVTKANERYKELLDVPGMVAEKLADGITALGGGALGGAFGAEGVVGQVFGGGRDTALGMKEVSDKMSKGGKKKSDAPTGGDFCMLVISPSWQEAGQNCKFTSADADVKELPHQQFSVPVRRFIAAFEREMAAGFSVDAGSYYDGDDDLEISDEGAGARGRPYKSG